MKVYPENEIKRMVNLFHDGVSEKHRYASFDFCYYYFQNNKNNLADNIEISCMYLWGYLASWGMLRGSGNLLQNSPASLKGLITLFAKNKNSTLWDIDVDNYNELGVIDEIINMYKSIKDELKGINPSVTLITKIMLGVFGCIPAFDTFFTYAMRECCDDCGYRSVNEKSLKMIGGFYINYKNVFDNIHINVIGFDGKITDLVYKKAKLIDMFGFKKGRELLA